MAFRAVLHSKYIMKVSSKFNTEDIGEEYI
jgi:hypothetical protein